MVNLQNPSVPPPTMAIEIDKAVYEIQLALDTNLDWLTHDYARAYRHLEKVNKRIYFPEIYVGGEKHSYHRVTPDNDKKGMCFFVVGKEQQVDFDRNAFNYLKWEIGICFWVNLKKIDASLAQNEVFTQNLVKDAREVLTRKLGGYGFDLKIKEVVREFNEIYKEFNFDPTEEYLRMPYQGFRFNCVLTLPEDCGNLIFDKCSALNQNLSEAEILTCVLPRVDFSNPETIDALSSQQLGDINDNICNSGGSGALSVEPLRTGQEISYAPNDDGFNQFGRDTDFLTLSWLNPAGNNMRFTDDVGGQDYNNNIYVDWTTYNENTGKVIGYTFGSKQSMAGKLWADWMIGQPYTIDAYSDWYVTNINQLSSLINYDVVGLLDYPPFNFKVINGATVQYSATTKSNQTTRAFALYIFNEIGTIGKTVFASSAGLFRYYTLAELGL